MRVIGKDLIQEFSSKYADSASAIESWRQVIEGNDFKTPVDLKRMYGTADYVKPYTIFDIGGNKYRLIASIDYPSAMVTIEEIMTHSEYEKGNWRR